MKARFFLFPVFFGIVLFGCRKSNDPSDSIVPDSGIVEPHEEYIEVGLKSSFFDYSETPMTTTKAFSDRDIFGVEIHDNNGNYYATWLTNDLGSDVIRLLKGRRYICYLVYMPNGQDIIETNPDGTLGLPFSPMGYVTVGTPKMNGGVFYGDYSIDFCNHGCALKKGLDSAFYGYNFWNDVDIYYGIQEIYSSEDINLTIDLYRMMFGLKIDVANFNSGTIKIAQGALNSTYVYELTPESPSLDIALELSGMPYSDHFNKPDEVPTQEELINWSTTGELFIAYVDPDGNEITLCRKGIDTKRMVKYSFSFDIEEVLSSINGSLSANIVDDGWTEESMELE